MWQPLPAMLESISVNQPAPAVHGAGTPRDQASGLRSLLKRRVLRVLPVLPGGDASGQGAAAAMLARQLAAAGSRVVLLDESGSALRALNLKPRHDLLALIEGELEFSGVAADAAPRLRCVAAAAGLPALIAADAAGEAFFAGFLRLADPADALVVNLAGTATSSGTLWLPVFDAPAAVLLVVGTAARDLTAAYATIKQANAGAASAPLFRILVNGAAGEREARAVCGKIAGAAQRFLGAQVMYAGHVPPTAGGVPLGRALSSQRHPEAAQALTRLAGELAAWPLAECAIDDPDSSHPN